MRILVSVGILVASFPAASHPGHGALELHWHAHELLWAALGAVVLAGIGHLVRKWLKR